MEFWPEREKNLVSVALLYARPRLPVFATGVALGVLVEEVEDDLLDATVEVLTGELEDKLKDERDGTLDEELDVVLDMRVENDDVLDELLDELDDVVPTELVLDVLDRVDVVDELLGAWAEPLEPPTTSFADHVPF